jgi:hypothetical protein
MPMEFQLLHRAVKGTPVVSLNTITHVVHIQLLARQIHNACILPTAAATRPARLHSPCSPSPLSPRWSPALLQPHRSMRDNCDEDTVTGVRTYIFSANLKTVDADPSTSSPATMMSRPPQPRADVDPTPPTITRTTTSFATEDSPIWTRNALSPQPPNLLYIHVNVD